MEQEKKSGGIMWAVIVVILALALYGGYRYMNMGETEADSAMDGASAPAGTTDASATASYKDGTYTATGNYTSPGGAESIEVTVTLADGVITDASVVSDAFRPESKMMQGQFISGFKAQVVGKKITDVKLTKVSGSSLTPKGWNDAIAKIQTEASA